MDSKAKKDDRYAVRDNLDVARKKMLPSSKEVAKAAFSAELTLKLVSDYKLTAVELVEMIRRLPDKAVPW